MGSGRFPLQRYNNGYKELVEAAKLIGEVIDLHWDSIYSGEAGGMQFDNAASDGGYLRELVLAKRIIEEALTQ